MKNPASYPTLRYWLHKDLQASNNSNAAANALAQRLGVAGKAAGIAGVTIGGFLIATAENKIEETARVASGVLGGITGMFDLVNTKRQLP